MNAIVLGAVILGLCQLAQAENFPVRPVRIVVANPPGGTADLIGRLLAKKLGEKWGETAVVDNRSGGAGVIGTDPYPLKPEEFDVFLAADAESTSRIIKAANIKPQ